MYIHICHNRSCGFPSLVSTISLHMLINSFCLTFLCAFKFQFSQNFRHKITHRCIASQTLGVCSIEITWKLWFGEIYDFNFDFTGMRRDFLQSNMPLSKHALRLFFWQHKKIIVKVTILLPTF